MPNLNLDVDAPEKVSVILRAAAQSYYESAGELEAAWQDKGAGKVWIAIARRLENAANSVDAAVASNT